MKVTETPLPGVLVIEPAIHGDSRGFFLETWHQDRYAACGITLPFVQDNLSRSGKGILRGLHLQCPHEQGKLVSVLDGVVFDVAVDVRVGSPSFGRWFGLELASASKQQLYIPPGFAHGFCATSDSALFAYKCTDVYDAASELGLAWNDPDIGIEWPIESPSLSAKDERAPTLAELDRARLPRFEG